MFKNRTENRWFLIIAGLIIGALIAVATWFVFFADTKVAEATQIDEPKECVEVNAPDPITFSKKIGYITYTFKWFENPDGTWKLYKDIDPRGGYEYWVYAGETIYEVDCPDPTPTPTLGTPPTFAGSSTDTPVCTSGEVLNLAANFHIIRSGSEATANWFVTGGDSANLYYKEVGQNNWTHSVPNINTTGRPDNFVSYTVGGLDPNLGYVFGLQQKVSCGTGAMVTSVIVDGPLNQLFQFSYWQW